MDPSPHLTTGVRASRDAVARVVSSRRIGTWMRGLTLSVSTVIAVACAGAPHAPPAALDADPRLDVPPPKPEAPLPAVPAPPLEPSKAVGVPSGNAAGDLVIAKGALGTMSKFPVFTDAGELPSLHAERADGDVFPLEHTDVRAELSGAAADVEVTQTFKNPKDHPIEAIYVFPLPENAAVHEMRLTVGDRVISSVIQERGAARKTYDAAKTQGMTAALLEEERSNVFTQSVANIEPGKKVEVTIRYTQELSYDAGIYELVFPMTVGPRFIAGTPTGGTPKGHGTIGDTNRVPDASRITPPYRSGLKPGKEISIEVITTPALAVGPFEVPNQKVKSHREADGSLDIRLADEDAQADRDFVLRYRVAGDEPRSTMLVDRDAGFFSLMLVPPNVDVDDLVGQRELVFVVDVSGSMNGAPLARCKEAMHEALRKLRPGDTFNILTFSGHTGKAFSEPRHANESAIRDALDFVDRMRAGGSTQMLDAVSLALTPDVANGRNRYVFFMTDGFVGEEDQIMHSTGKFVSTIEHQGKRAKVFGFGVGSSPNRNLIEGLSREGKGVAVYASNREDPSRAVNQFFRYIDRSVLRDVKIDWGSNPATDVMPGELPDLFASRPLLLHGRLKGLPKGPVVVHATSARGGVDIPVTVADFPKLADDAFSRGSKDTAKAPRAGLLGTLWARSRVTWLEGDLASGSSTAQADITKLGLDYGLVTRFTSFVAVDRSKRVEGAGASETILQPSDVPEGVSPSVTTQPSMPPPAPPSGGGEGDSAGAKPVEPAMDLEEAPAPPAERGARGCACTFATPDFEQGSEAASLSLIAMGLWLSRRYGSRREKRRES